MKEYIDQVNSKIKSRTKEQWVHYLNHKIQELRAYISDNGEVAFIAAFVLGIFVVIFFKLAFALFFIFALLCGMVWCLAESEIEIRGSLKSSPVSPVNEEILDEEDKKTPIQ